MGEGDDELGLLLMSNFVKAIKDLDSLPQKIVFYNRGVTLAAIDSTVVSDLTDIERMGVELLLCSTCISHLNLEAKIGVGTASNIFTIAEVMVSAGKIIKP
jgi:selenium metabolism protein YedF